MNAIQKFIEAEHKYLDLNEIDYKEYEQMVAPLRDVECVVRCKDCKAWKQYDDLNLGGCELFPEYNKMGDWFCNFGERKEGDGE